MARRAGGVPLVYVAGYRPEILGFLLDLHSGSLTPAGSAVAGTAPSFLAWDRSAKFLFAVAEVPAGRVTAFAIRQRTDPPTAETAGTLTELNTAASGGIDPAHLSVDGTGRWLLVANYAGKQPGTVSVLPIGVDGRLGEPVDTRDLGAASRPHMVLADPQNHFVLVPCPGGAYVARLRFDAATGKLGPNDSDRRTWPGANDPDRVTWPGARAPRHLAFHPSGRFVYVIDEQAMTMTVLGYDAATGRLTYRQTLSTLLAGVSAVSGYSTAEVVVHPSGKFLYGSNRGHNSLVIYRLDRSGGRLVLAGHETRAIQQPRHFSIDPTGRLLLVANERSDSVTVFRIDQNTGLLEPLGQPVPAGRRPTFVGVLLLGK